jgi:translation initiation factor IF-2
VQGNTPEEHRLQQTKDIKDSKEKVRVFALARTLGVDSKTLIDLCKSLGFDVKSQLASLEPEQVDALKQRIARGVKPAAEPAKPAAQVIPPKDKKIVNLVGKPRPEARAEPEVVSRHPELAETLPEGPQILEEAPAHPAAPPAAVEVLEAAEAAPAATPVDVETAKPTIPESQVPAGPTPQVPPSPPKLPTLAPGGMRNLSGGVRPPTAPRPPAAAPPRTSAGTPAARSTPTAPPTARPGTPRPGAATTGAPARPPAGAPGAGGGPAARGPAERHRRTEGQRGMGTVAQPGAGRPPAGESKRGIGGQTRFTAEQLQQFRDGKSLREVLAKAPPSVPGTGVGQVPGKADETEELDEEGKKKLPGKVVGRDARHADRAKRQEQRKVRQSNVVIQDGHVDLIEDERIRRRKSAKALMKKRQPGTVERKGKVPISLPINVRSLSEAIGMKVGELLNRLKDLTNSLYTINSSIETEVAELIATEKGIEFEIIRPKNVEEDLFEEHKQADDESKLEPRAPVVTVMGHVDHGKTSLLDKIRESNVVATEAGGITQVIRAWRVVRNGKAITFLDTPGHEAFTKMRARGANVTDIAVIVVAANDGVMPQTEEAISHAKAAGVSIVVAINKVDLPDSNVKRTEQQLYGLGLIPDTMGGDVQFVHTSATKGTGIDELLDTLLLVAEVKELKANPHKPASGTCLEAYLDPEEGVFATLLIQQGTLRQGDAIICGASYGRVRAMYDDLGNAIDEAGPSVPVRITGLDEVPNADDHFHVVTEMARAREIAEQRKARAQESQFKPREPMKLETLGVAKTKIAELKVVLKAEARGSIEAIRKELEKLVHEEVRVRLLHAGIGAITESDVQLALASPEDTIVVGFNVVPDDQAMHLAEERGIPIREYQIIYKLTEDIKAALEGKLKPREEVIHLGRAVIREVFKISRVGTVAGCYVTQGVIERSAKVRVIREGAVVYPPADKVASLDSLKRFKDDVREVREGYDCGMKIAGYDDIKVNDVIEAYRIEQVQRTL